MRIPRHEALTDEELGRLGQSGPSYSELRSLVLSYKALREHHVLEVGELTRRLNRALYLANGYLTDIEGEDSSAYDYEQERRNLDALAPPGVARSQQGVSAAPHDAPGHAASDPEDSNS